jgi:protein lifeguard
MSHYPQPPPTYGAALPSNPKYTRPDESRDPLLDFTGQSSSSGRAFYDQPSQGELPDDFKVHHAPFLVQRRSLIITLCVLQYGVTVSESSPEIRAAFVRKVYSILCE